MNLTTILYCIYCLITTSPPTEVMVFDIIRQERVIGELKAVRIVADDLTFFRSQTKISVHIVKRIQVEYEFFVTMKKDQLVSAEATILVNGKIKEHTITKWQGDEYRIEDRKGRINWISEPITYSGVHLLFEEPIDVSQVYSEEAGVHLSIMSLSQNWYKKFSPKGKENFYYYENGELQRADMKAGMLNFHIVLQDDK